MAKFLNTTGVSYHLEELIKGTKDRLILISPYLQLHNRVKDNIENLNIQKRDIRIIYRENKLKVEESNWLESQIGVRTSVCSSLHAKCYLNENEAIVTSMNLYSFSQQNNDEMGIHVTKNEDPELYKDISEEAQRLLTISDEIRVSVKKIDKVVETIKPEIKIIEVKKENAQLKLLSTKELSREIGETSRKINAWLVENSFMYRQSEDWLMTKKGEDFGGLSKSGQYGKFITWPESIIEKLEQGI